MSMFPWKPLRLSLDLESEIDRAFAELIDQPWGRSAAGQFWQPDIDVFETDDAYLIQADLPGVSVNDVEVQIEPGAVTISGTRRSANLFQSGHGIRLERRHGRFFRRFPLKHPVDADKVEVGHEEGIILIRLPKKQPPPAEKS